MRTFRLIGMTLLMVMLTVNFTACSDDDDDNELSLPVDNTLELLIGTWEGTGEVAGRLFKFNEDYTYSYDTPYSNETENGTFEYFPNRYMFVTYYTNDWGQGDWKEENIIYTIVKITEDELILNNNGHSDIIIFKRK
ncbi:hypothetical protein [Phocaeicola vulgatus]|uniref:Lipocalin-like domain-containing protein n=1 Tax=Phocaeicola vulgatus TaxID=821 RepID=A0A848QHE2_PHOVU|nr:hypothetical protein [Phocaeicola vulgatus]NMW38705.1 hypothetical protein [Phocaeicola vulgatus]